LDFLGRFKKKISNTKFHEIPSSGSPVVPCGQTDGHDEGRFSQFRESAKTKNTPAYERVFCHLTICLPPSTPKQKLPSLFLLEKKVFSTEISGRCPIYLQLY
jgi:hypothetical protein